MIGLAGKRVAITGAASGIGRATAAALTAAGAHLALLDVDEAGLLETAAELGHGVQAHHCDVTDPTLCRSAIEAAVSALGGLDILINNAGITHRSLVSDTEASVLHRVMAVNYFGAVHCTQAALPPLIESRGSIVAISSVAGFAPLLGRAGYAASKHALHGFFDTLRAELRDQGVTVLIVCPSFADTPIEDRALSGSGGRAENPRAVVGRLISAAEVAARIVQAIAAGDRQVVLTPVGKASWWISRLAPALYARLMRRSQAQAFGLG